MTTLREFLFGCVYKSPLVVRQNFKADHVLERLFTAVCGGVRLGAEYAPATVPWGST